MQLIFHGEQAFRHGDLILSLLVLTYPLPHWFYLECDLLKIESSYSTYSIVFC